MSTYTLPRKWKKSLIKIVEQLGFNPKEVLEWSRGEVEINFKNEDDKFLFERVFRKTSLNIYGGYSTGYGAKVIQANYIDMGDFNDACSAHHY